MTLLEWLLERLGDASTVVLAGLVVGVIYGVSAQRSRFCLRAATVEMARGALGPRLGVWLLGLATAVFWVQLGLATGELDLSESRWAAGVGSISGALIGGLMFGAGMVLARGCPGRLLVLGGSGNLRALLAIVAFAVAAHTTLNGALRPLRDQLFGLWTTGGPNPDLLAAAGFGAPAGIALALIAALAAWRLSIRNRVSPLAIIASCGVGAAVAIGWWLTATLAGMTFDPTPVESLTFSSPLAELVSAPTAPVEEYWDFDIGLAPGAILGAAAAALLFGEWKVEAFKGVGPTLRQIFGAALMGAGSVLALGCSIGVGLTGVSVFALTAWIALAAFWAGAMATDYLVDRPREAARTAKAAA